MKTHRRDLGFDGSMIVDGSWYYPLKEQHELEENNLYKQYVDKRDRCVEYNNRGRSLNRLALQALNAVNIISQDDQTSRVAFVWRPALDASVAFPSPIQIGETAYVHDTY